MIERTKCHCSTTRSETIDVVVFQWTSSHDWDDAQQRTANFLGIMWVCRRVPVRYDVACLCVISREVDGLCLALEIQDELWPWCESPPRLFLRQLSRHVSFMRWHQLSFCLLLSGLVNWSVTQCVVIKTFEVFFFALNLLQVINHSSDKTVKRKYNLL